jgi:SAM-dependent methyltransferase
MVFPLRPVPLSPNVGSSDEALRTEVMVPLDVWLCRDCGHIQLINIVSADMQYTNYRYTTHISRGLPEHFRTLFEDISLRFTPAARALIVEIGSNDGTVLRYFQESGQTVLGVDPAREIAERATASGIETWPTYFTTDLAGRIRAERGPATVVIANNVMANTDALDDMIGGVRDLLEEGGVFVFETQYGVDVFEKRLIDTIYHEHISYFNVKPLQALFARHGMELIDVQRIPVKGGSIRGTAQVVGGGRAVAASVAALIAEEAALGYHQPERFVQFTQEIEALREHIRKVVLDRLADGRRVAGYGASVGSVTLLHYLDLTAALDFIADDAPLGPALTGPGYSIPILPGENLLVRRPALTLVLAWRYAESIMARHQAYRADGGQFLIPLPTLDIR